MSIVAVLYTYNDLPEKRAEVLPLHREFLGSQPNLVLSGPTSDGSGLIVFEGEVAEIEALMDGDPFAAAGLIASRRVFEWDLVLGRWAKELGLV